MNGVKERSLIYHMNKETKNIDALMERGLQAGEIKNF
jgi:hypothetical protein